MPTDSTPNLLVLSDLHLGEDLSPAATETTRRDLSLAERHLVKFIRHYTRRRVDGRPWRLVVNGDMVDFFTICVLPGDPRMPKEAAAARRSEDHDHGLGRRVEVARAKLAAALDRHGDVVNALARFCAAGNYLTITTGNHDAELHWPQVQEDFRARIARAWVASSSAERDGAATAEEVAERISFHVWFYYEPGVAWIEHGHQYDECCSFEYGLSPADAKGEIVPNVDSAALRYIGNRNPDLDPHVTDHWTFLGYLQFTWSLGLRGAARLAKSYYNFSKSLVRAWRVSRSPLAKRRRSARHERRMERLAAESDVPLASLREIDGMRRLPIVSNLRRLSQVLMLDRLVITIGTVFLVLIAILALPLVWALLVAGAIAAGGHFLGAHVSRGRMVDSTVPLQLVPERIVRHVDARYVVFGHTHEPLAHKLDGDRWYFNTGTWLPSGRPGLLRSFTHLVIRHGARGPSATLCQWRDGASRAFTPGWIPERTTGEIAAPASAATTARIEVA